MSDFMVVPGLTEEEQTVFALLQKRLERKTPRNRLRSAYYDGHRAIHQIGSVIPKQYARLGLALGWAAKGVDGLARRVNLDGFSWAEGDLNSLGLQELEDDNFLLAELAKARTDALIHGVSFLVVSQGVDGEPPVLVHARDALNGTGEWNNRTRHLDNFLSVTVRDGANISAFNLFLPNLTVTASRGADGWTVERSEHSWGVPVEPLVYRPRVSRVMGHSRITRPLMGIQDAALRALIRMEAHMDIYAIPKMLLLGANEASFKNADGSPKTSWQVVMGRVLGIPDDDDPRNPNPRVGVQQLSAESPAPHISQLNALAKLAARETDLPDSDFALTDLANPTSADAYTASRENLINEAEGFMDDLNVPLRRTIALALSMLNGREIPNILQVQPKWRSPIYLSRAAAADAGLKQLQAIPWLADTTVGLELIGLSPQQIERAEAEKRQAAGRQVLATLKATNAVAE